MSDEVTKVVSGLPLGHHTVKISKPGVTVNEQIEDAVKAINDSIEYTFYGTGLDVKTSDFKGLSESLIEVDGMTITETKGAKTMPYLDEHGRLRQDKSRIDRSKPKIYPDFMKDLEKI